MSLDDLPSEVALLKSLTKHPAIPNFTPSQEAYHPIEAHLRLYLGNNMLERVPNSVFELTNLRVLSLRQNGLTRLPYAIGKLLNLQSLNISGNKLETLPFELLDLAFRGNLIELIVEPNPWRQVDQSSELCSIESPWVGNNNTCLRCVASNSTELLRPNGAVEHVVSSHQLTSTMFDAVATSSLTVMALHRMSGLQSLQSLEGWIGDGIPETVQTILETALEHSKIGPRRCSACTSDFILPRSQRIEWWSIDFKPSGSFLKLPFLRQQCQKCSITCYSKLTLP